MALPLPARRPWAVIVVALLGVVLAGAVGGDVQDSLVSGGFDDPGSESAAARTALEETFDAGGPDLTLLVTAAEGDVDAPAVTRAATALADDLAARPEVAEVVSYWGLGGAPPLRSASGDRALVLVRLAGDEEARLDAAATLREELPSDTEVMAVQVGGITATFAEINEVVEEDLVAAELIALPVTLVLLIVIFGSVVSALLPLAIGGLAILGTFLALELIAGVTDVSVFALNFTTALGLGLAIDYALLVVNRFREELAAGHDVTTAVVRTRRTAGRTVLFSGLTVASSLAALAVFQFAFLRSFAWAGIAVVGLAVVGLAVVGAVVVLPALLTVLGHRVNALTVRRVRTAAPGEATEGTWHRIAMAVMRRPVPIATVSTLLLLVLGLPFLDVALGFPDDRVLPPGAETRQVADVLREEFDSREASAVTVVLSGVADAEEVEGYAVALSGLDGVARVDAATGTYAAGGRLPVELPDAVDRAVGDRTHLSVISAVEPLSDAGRDLVAAVRAVGAPAQGVLVGGPSAELTDSVDGLLDRLPVALALIAVITFVVLFLSFGSVLMPLKAIVLNLLSLTATLGAMVWVFQQGRFEEALGFTATGSLAVTMPVLLFVLAFGLSMDYEVFLLSRIKEEWDATGDPIGSVASGLERTGRIVTAAAVLIAVVFVSFGLTGSVSFMKLFGFGMTLAVLADAFIVRTTLVPAFMRLAGTWNWWAPAPLRRLHERIGFSEVIDLDDDTASTAEDRRPATV
ncbi:MMPL family transporter [Euzebya sp.]|uniref:MMPL family transporter n=1 Tax=Euzebya sp. TaxID=1971409 RepID=UPI0035169F16